MWCTRRARVPLQRQQRVDYVPISHLSHKGAVWLVDAKPLSPFTSRLLNAGHSSRGNGQRPSPLAWPDVAGLFYSWPMAASRSPPLPPRWASAVALSTSGRGGFWSRASQDWPTNPAVAPDAGSDRLTGEITPTTRMEAHTIRQGRWPLLWLTTPPESGMSCHPLPVRGHPLAGGHETLAREPRAVSRMPQADPHAGGLCNVPDAASGRSAKP
jgi:hypothetical protein